MRKISLLLAIGGLLGLCACQTPSKNSEPSELPEYTITWVVDGETSTETYKEGETPVYKYGTEKEADNTYTYTFDRWEPAIVPVTQDATYTAKYTQSYVEYVVTWSIDGVDTNENYHYGDTPSYKNGTPAKAKDVQYTYTFSGWDKELVPVTANVTYTAQFSRELNEYTITFVVGDVITTQTYTYGETPSYSGTPTKPSDAQYTYTFSGWDKEFAPVTGDETYTAQFTSTVNTYTVTWVVGNEQFTEEYEYGETPSFKGSTDRESAKYIYTFTGWNKELAPVTGDETYIAQYSEEIRKFIVNFYNDDGSSLLFSQEVEYDAAPTYGGTTPTKAPEGEYTYEFASWLNKETGLSYDGALPTIIGAVNYYATFSAIPNPYELHVNLLKIDGTQAAEMAVESFGYHTIYTFNAPEISGLVPNKDFIKGYKENRVEEDTIYYSQLDIYDGESVSTAFEGTGTEDDPYLIQSGADLALLRKTINEAPDDASAVNYIGNFFKMTKSIDLTAAPNFMIGLSKDRALGATFDGNNCSIRGVNITSTAAGAALFSRVNPNAIIKNLSVYGEVNGKQYCGGIAGNSYGTLQNLTNYVALTQNGANGAGGIAGGSSTNTAMIENCVNYGSIDCVSNHNKTAGIAGLAEGTIKNSVNFGTLSGYQFLGGIIGEAMNTNFLECSNCVNYGEVNHRYDGAGVVGQLSNKTGILRNLVNYGNVTSSELSKDANGYFTAGVVGRVLNGGLIEDCINRGVITGGARIGGICGQFGSNANTEEFKNEMKNCVNYGKVESLNNGNAYAGGIIGVADRICSITGCVNHGEVIGKSYYAGGILACVATNGVVTLTNCINNANVTCSQNGVGGIVGGGIATNSTSYIVNCTNNGNVNGVNKVGGIIGSIKKGSVDDDCVNNGQVTGVGEAVGDIIGSDERPS